MLDTLEQPTSDAEFWGVFRPVARHTSDEMQRKMIDDYVKKQLALVSELAASIPAAIEAPNIVIKRPPKEFQDIDDLLKGDTELDREIETFLRDSDEREAYRSGRLAALEDTTRRLLGPERAHQLLGI